jgi:pimeloyl-ACP methyl ester carboxylesterase
MRQNATDTVGSADGTRIAFERAGSGPAVIMVDPAGGYGDVDNIRGLGAVLAEHFTVYTYDRRGRGLSGVHLVSAHRTAGSCCPFGKTGARPRRRRAHRSENRLMLR